MPRCLLLSNRLPLAYDEELKKFVPSSGGLVSAIKGLDAKKIGYDFEWMGEVEYIGLKTTRIRSLHGEQIIISNSDLLRSRIRNMKRMHERRNSLQFALPHESSPQRIKQVVEIITAVVSSKNEVRFERCHYYKVTPTALEIEVVYFILSNNHQLHMDLQQTILLEIHQIFNEEGVIYASPTQKMHLLNKVPLEQQGSAQIQS